MVSGGVSSTPYSVTIPTGPLTAPADLAVGTIKNSDNSNCQECLVFIRMSVYNSSFDITDHSLWVSAITDSNGGYTKDVLNIRQDPNNPFSANFNAALSYNKNSANDTFTLVAQGAPGANGTLSISTDNTTQSGGDFINMDITFLPLPTFAITGATVDEAAGTASVVISLSPTTSDPTSVQYQTVNGTAVGGSDFTAAGATTLNFTAGQSSSSVSVTITDDALDELTESFTVQILNSLPSASTTIATSSATVTITDNDAIPTLAAGLSSVNEGNSGTTTTVPAVSVALSAVSGLPIALHYTTTAGSATAGNDYESASGATFVIPAGSSTVLLPIDIFGDTTYEADEVFTVVIGDATTTGTTTAVTITQSVATTTILNDDSLVAVADPNYTTTEDTALVVVAPGVQGNDTIFGIVSWTSTVENTVATGTLNAFGTDGSFTYTPPPDFPYTSTTGTVTFIYRIDDGRFTSTATVTINVSSTNDAPVTQDILFPVLPDATTTVAAPGVLAKAYDVDGDTLTASVIGSVSTGTLNFNADGSFEYNPGSFKGTATFVFRANDGTANSNTSTASLSQGPTWQLSLDKTSVDEDSSTVVATITLINASGTVPSTVLFSTADGTASAGASDYGAQSETIQLAGTVSNTTASTTRTVTITNDTGDPVREGNETFFIRLSNASIESGGLAGSVVSGGSGGVVTTTVTIDDPQDAPTVAVADATVAEGGVAQVTVTLTGKTALTTTVSYLSQVTSTGNALLQAVESGGQDYTAASGTLTFDPHPTTTVATLSIAVTTTQDTIDELNEIFAVDICGCLDLQKTGATGVSPLTSTDEIAIVTITDDDNAPSLAVVNQKIVETAAGAATTTSATITVTLTGASSGGVTTTVVTAVSVAADATTTITSSATAAQDYQTTSAVLTWAPDETGDKTFIVKVIDDAVEEDLETVVLVISNTTTATSTLGVTVSDNWGLLRIVDDEPAAKVVGITSDGEAIRGDWFFLVVAGADSDALGVSAIVSAAVSSTGNIVTGNVNPIAMVDDIVRGMHGLNTVRSKVATHAWLYMVPTSTQLGTLGFDFTLTYGSGGPVNLTSTAGSSINLEVVGSRSNRNFFLSPGLNFTGLGLVPLNSSTATQLEQAVVSDVDTQFADAVAASNNEREVRLKDVVSTVFIFDCPDTDKPTCVVSNVSTASWSSYLTVDPLATGTAPFAGTLLLEPFHGMIVKTRQTSGAGSQSVFATVTHGNLGTVEVPIKMNIKGPFIDVTTNVPLAPPEQKLRFGWNLVAPHTQEAAPFNIVFNDVVVPEVLASRAISFIREVTVGAGSSVVGTIVQQFAIATWQEIIRPEFAYWVRINPHPAGSVTPIIGPSGVDGGSSK